MCGAVQPAAENSPQFTKSLVHGKRPFSAGTMHAVASALAPISALPGSEPPSGLPMPGEASAGTEQGEAPDQALHRALAAQMQHTVGQLTGQPAGQPASGGMASAPSLQRPPAPLFVGQVMFVSTIHMWLIDLLQWYLQQACLLDKYGKALHTLMGLHEDFQNHHHGSDRDCAWLQGSDLGHLAGQPQSSALGVQSMQSMGMQGMSHLSRGLLAGLQPSHMPSLDTSLPFQLQLSSSFPSPQSSQGARVQSYGGNPQSGAFSFAARPPMVNIQAPAVADQSYKSRVKCGGRLPCLPACAHRLGCTRQRLCRMYFPNIS